VNPDQTQVAIASKGAVSTFNLNPRNFEEAWRLAEILADSELVPKDFRAKPGNCLVAIQWGAEVGLCALQSVQNIAVINGRPSMWGDALIALVRSSPLCEWIIESDDGQAATCRVKRRGEPEQSRTFGMDDAKTSGLLGKSGPWTQYPKRMRQMRARAFALRDVFPDVLKGIPMAEEALDTPAERHMGPVDEVPPPAQARPALPDYSQADFEKNLPAWKKAVASGKKTASALLAMLQTKATFSEEQKAQILSLKVDAQDATPAAPPADPPPASGEHDDFVDDMNAAESAQGA
jgi:hypothetical protein